MSFFDEVDIEDVLDKMDGMNDHEFLTKAIKAGFNFDAHTLVAIGSTGSYKVYINHTVDESKEKYFESEGLDFDTEPDTVEEYFDEYDDLNIKTMIIDDDEFEAYDVWPV